MWAIIARHEVTPHPAYGLGWSRVSCRSCIFGSPNQWASLRAVFPEAFWRIAAAEAATGWTFQRRASVVELADRGRPYAAALQSPELVIVLRGTRLALLDEGDQLFQIEIRLVDQDLLPRYRGI